MATQTSKTGIWSWKISDEEMKNQVENYKTLKITKSYRGISVLAMSCILAFSLVLGFFNIVTTVGDVLLSLIIYIPVLIFVYKGHRWAIIALLVLWTLEKVLTLSASVEMGSSPLSSIIWWLIIAPYMYKALKVENERRKIVKTISAQ